MVLPSGGGIEIACLPVLKRGYFPDSILKSVMTG